MNAEQFVEIKFAKNLRCRGTLAYRRMLTIPGTLYRRFKFLQPSVARSWSLYP